MPRVLLTGGAGFIGSHLARALLASGYEVEIVDDFSTGARANVPEGAPLHELNLAGDAFVKKLPVGPFDAVLQLYDATKKKLINPQLATTDSVVGTITLGDETGNVAYDQTKHTMYATARTPDALVAIDPVTRRITNRIRLPGCDGAHGVWGRGETCVPDVGTGGDLDNIE